jgi:hypothetical protein
MGTIYEWTFFLALGLLAIVITVFVFAVSLLGRALEAAAESEKKKLGERRDKNAREMAAIRRKISKAERKGQVSKGLIRKLQKELKKLEERDEKDEKELGKIRKAPKLLTVKGGVVPCGGCLLAALVLSGSAWYVSDIQIFDGVIPVLIWIPGLAAVGYTISRIYQCLKVIEGVAITSEEAALKRTVEAFKIAQKELEEEKKPGLELEFKGKEFPLHVKADSEVKLPLELFIHKGEFAEDVAVHICAPPGFSFPKEDTYTLDSDYDYPNYICLGWILTSRLIGGLQMARTITIKSPPSKGSFKIVYYIFCRGFRSKATEREVIVE